MGERRWRARSSRDVRAAALIGLGLAVFVVGTYVAVVVGGGALTGQSHSPRVALSVLATAVVALGFETVRTSIEGGVARMFPGTAVSAYDALSRFTGSVTGGYPPEELPRRMAMLLAQGTGARWAQVWLAVNGRMTLAAHWPEHVVTPSAPPVPLPDARDGTDPGRRAVAVRSGGQVFGVFRLEEEPDVPLTSVEERLVTGLAAQAGLVLRAAGLRAQLAGRHEELLERAAELRRSRERLIETQDAERRNLERDIHDGAQQHLVALAVNLRLAATVAARAPERAASVVAEQVGAAQAAVDNLSALSRGIYPGLLSDEGLVPALRQSLATAPVAVSVRSLTDERPPAEVETALYFFAMEAVQNSAKHASAAHTSVSVDELADSWRVTVSDDGVGFDLASQAAGPSTSGLVNMRDRLDAVGGAVAIQSFMGSGTTIVATVPAQRRGD